MAMLNNQRVHILVANPRIQHLPGRDGDVFDDLPTLVRFHFHHFLWNHQTQILEIHVVRLDSNLHLPATGKVLKIDSCEKNAISDTLPMLSKVYLNTCTCCACCAWDRNLSNNNSQTSSIVAPPLHQQPTLAQKSFTWALSLCSPAKDCGRWSDPPALWDFRPRMTQIRVVTWILASHGRWVYTCDVCQNVYPHIHAIDACFVKIWLFQNVQFVGLVTVSVRK